MNLCPRVAHTVILAGLSCLGALGLSADQAPAGRKPEVTLTATPIMAFIPAKISFSAAIRGGDDDYEEFYCASVEWDWDDGTTSEAASDCEPYQPGKSRIRRNYTAHHNYDVADTYHPAFRLKKKNKVVSQARADIEVRPGHYSGAQLR